MHGPAILAALQRDENTLEAELARLVQVIPTEAGELVESAALYVAQARKLLVGEVGGDMRGDLLRLAEMAEAIATLLHDAARKAREADIISMSEASEAP
jgi:hypothetical protein